MIRLTATKKRKLGLPVKHYKIEPDFRKKSGKLFLAIHQKGLRNCEAAKEAGITEKNVPNLQATRNYQVLVETYAEALKSKISMNDLATEQIKNIRQDIDKGAKNVALKQVLDRLEPIENESMDFGAVNIVIRKE